MYSNFKEQAIEYVKQAVQEDNAGNYSKAFPLYMNALEYFKTHLKYEKNPKIREAITQKFTEYLRRAEEIRTVLDEGGPGPNSNGDAAVATRPKTKPKDGEDGDDPEKDKLRSGLNSAIVREKPNVKWNDVAGLESAKQALQEAVILPVKFPQFFTGKRRPWRAFLLYGPPGTGKSYLAKAVATEADSTFFSISSSDLVSKWMGESEKLVSNLFQMARESAPSIIFVDEIDSLCGQRGEGNESEASRRIKTELLVQMQGVGTNDQKVLVLAATNTPYALDQAIRRRFDKRIYIPLPDLKARQHIFKVHLGDTPHNLTESDFESLARRTEGFSGSDISVCVKDVLFEPVRKTQDAMFFIHASNDMWIPCGPKHPGAVQISMQDLAAQGLAEKILPPPIMKTDFDKVLARQKPTVSKTDLDVHERFTKEFGEEVGRVSGISRSHRVLRVNFFVYTSWGDLVLSNCIYEYIRYSLMLLTLMPGCGEYQPSPSLNAETPPYGIFLCSQPFQVHTPDPAKIKREDFLVCMAEALIDDPRKKAVAARLGGGVAMILIDPIVKEICFQFVVPSTLIGQEEAQQLQAFMQAQKNPTARIAPTVTILNSKPAPKVTVFSSQGPNIKTPDTIKPGITAPGLNILAAWSPVSTDHTARRSVNYSIISGTSMSCPHVPAVAAILKSYRPSWSLAAIKSAIMTTAIVMANTRKRIGRDPNDTKATPFDYGSGHINPLAAFESRTSL
ncbi:AAA-TYPE ATPASE FAMILY PROTEIN [Salix purpurea]|uniref:AAA-TYPE ATPASE FAMILY PROTEIN n=1 Tax=Salix purpurea TaxID=77065 RepID=A0A9Q0SXQ2_SALPP|nr:AAA-TYPE ATPASE FAMILY PROTEIN [Salix purpurea]